MPTTCAKAIQNFAEKVGMDASEAEVVDLCGQTPPLEKLDASLAQLTRCKKLSLSTNSVERLTNLGVLSRLEILSVGRNLLRRIQGLEELTGLKQLWMSHNQIDKLDGLGHLSQLQVLYMSNNKIKDAAELDKLRPLEQLSDVLFRGNPFLDGLNSEDTQVRVVRKIPQLQLCEGLAVTQHIREVAANAE